MANRRFLRRLIGLQALVLAAVMLFGMAEPAVTAYADNEDYTYKIRVFSGNQGTIDGEDMVEDFLEKIPIGTKCTVSAVQGEENATLTLTLNGSDNKTQSKKYEIKLKNNSKYYVKGIRESGRDNNTALVEMPSITVTKDTDYVIAYGMQGKMVPYTIRYQDKNGKTLAPSDTYYGKVGDKPVVAAPYIEGYYPDAKNKTGTLKDGENVWTFIYQKESTGTSGSSGGNTTTTTTTTTRTTVGGNTTEEGEEEGGEEGGEEEGGEEEEGGGTGTSTDNLPQTAEDVPDIVDIDDQETPLAEFTETETAAETTAATAATEAPASESETRETIDIRDSKTPQAGLSTPAKVGIGVGIVALIAALLWYFLYKRKGH